jgi:hypothetical protein
VGAAAGAGWGRSISWQELKPDVIQRFAFGTTEVAPCYKARLWSVDGNECAGGSRFPDGGVVRSGRGFRGRRPGGGRHLRLRIRFCLRFRLCVWLRLGLRGLAAAGSRAGFAREAAEGDLGGVDELGAQLFVDGIEDHALSDAGDEAADVVFAAEKWHGVAVGFAGGFDGVVVCFAFVFRIGDGAVPGFAAAFYFNKRGPIGACRVRVGHDFYL